MRPIVWNSEALGTGDAEIDSQHRRMIDIFNALHDAAYAGAAGMREDLMLDELLRVAADNFRAEEALMAAHPESAGHFHGHRQVHRGLLAELQMLRDGLFKRGEHINLKTVNFVRTWLYEHIVHSDQELRALVRGRGLEPQSSPDGSRADH